MGEQLIVLLVGEQLVVLLVGEQLVILMEFNIVKHSTERSQCAA